MRNTAPYFYGCSYHLFLLVFPPWVLSDWRVKKWQWILWVVHSISGPALAPLVFRVFTWSHLDEAYSWLEPELTPSRPRMVRMMVTLLMFRRWRQGRRWSITMGRALISAVLHTCLPALAVTLQMRPDICMWSCRNMRLRKEAWLSQGRTARKRQS